MPPAYWAAEQRVYGQVVVGTRGTASKREEAVEWVSTEASRMKSTRRSSAYTYRTERIAQQRRTMCEPHLIPSYTTVDPIQAWPKSGPYLLNLAVAL